MSESETPRRLVSADVIRMQHEALTAALTRTAEPYVTVEFTRNAKGETQISTKISAPVNGEGFDLHAAATAVYNEAQSVYETATRRYPTSAGTVTNDSPPFE